MLRYILHVADNSDMLNSYSNLLCQPSYNYMQQQTPTILLKFFLVPGRTETSYIIYKFFKEIHNNIILKQGKSLTEDSKSQIVVYGNQAIHRQISISILPITLMENIIQNFILKTHKL
jgi:hypothetical protein